MIESVPSSPSQTTHPGSGSYLACYSSPGFPTLLPIHPLLTAAREIVLKCKSDSVITPLLEILGGSLSPTNARPNIFSREKYGPRELLFICQGPFNGLFGRAVLTPIPSRVPILSSEPHTTSLFSLPEHTGQDTIMTCFYTSTFPIVWEPETMSNVLCSPRAQH